MTVSPASPTIVLNGTQTFTATVAGTGSPSQEVTWAATNGTITSAGLYTAPPAGTTDTVTATSVLNTAVAGSTTVTLQAAPTATSVLVTPSSTTLVYGASLTFTATVLGTNGPSQAVTWQARAGTINAAGLYTAPGSGTTDAVTATASANPAATGTATITLQAMPTVPLVWNGTSTWNNALWQ